MYRQNSKRNALGRVIGSDAKVVAPGKLNSLVGRAQHLEAPTKYGKGLDWASFRVPRNVLCFLCDKEDHSLRSWSPLSTLSGKFHQYNRYCLVIALEGNGILGVDGSYTSLEEGEAFLVAPGQKHYYLSISKQFSWLYLMFDFGADDDGELSGLVNTSRVVSRKSRRLLNQILESYGIASTANEVFELSLAVNDLLEDLSTVSEVERVVEELSFVQRVNSSVFSHLEKAFSLEETAENLGMSATQLKDEYRRATGESLGNFVRAVRLVHASNMLREGKMAPELVAEYCGFRSMESFEDAFKTQYRVLPQNYPTREESV